MCSKYKVATCTSCAYKITRQEIIKIRLPHHHTTIVEGMSIVVHVTPVMVTDLEDRNVDQYTVKIIQVKRT